jgi:hypothetical protein
MMEVFNKENFKFLVSTKSLFHGIQNSLKAFFLEQKA